jgi:Tannase-like family of unknown function (DUF6351)
MSPATRLRVRAAVVVIAVLAVVAGSGVPVNAAEQTDADHGVHLRVLSSRPDQVTGGNALVQVQVPSDVSLSDVTLLRNGSDVTGELHPDGQPGSLVGLVDGLNLGSNTLVASASGVRGRPTVSLTLTDFPVSGPIFSGPQQQPFVCKTEQSGLGQPLVDNQNHTGLPVFALDANGAKTTQIVGWSSNCATTTRVDYLYRTTGNQWKPLPADGSRPSDLATTTTIDGTTRDFIVRWERGTINRFIYSIAMLAPLNDNPAHPDDSVWNRRLIYSFSSGGVGIGHQQGTLGTTPDSMFEATQGLAAGYAVAYSTGNVTGVHYNLQLAGETALMVKEHFIKQHGLPLYTVGVGASGGGLQQYVYGQDFPGLIDAAIPVYAYPDEVTQAIHVGDCELLEYFMDVTDAANPAWQDWTNRSMLIGLNGSNAVRNPYTGANGSDECVNGWRGLTPLMLNPNFGSAGSNQSLMEPAGVMNTVKWTHYDDLRNIYGVKPDGYARATYDNVGVQYGLQALVDNKITPDEFLKLNATVGGWKSSEDMVQEGAPFIPGGTFDPWSSRNMMLSPDGGVTPASRTVGDLSAIRAAYDNGLVFQGRIDIPIIDWRHYLEDALNMHNSRQSFASRQRIIETKGNADNQVIWFTDARPNGPQTDAIGQAFQVMDQWLANMREHPDAGVVGNKPPLATDRCFATDGTQIAAGPHVWDGILDNQPAGACTQRFPIHSTSRIIAGGPFDEDSFKCQLEPVANAIALGTYGDWHPDMAQRDRLEQIFPNGVCDFRKRPADLTNG